MIFSQDKARFLISFNGLARYLDCRDLLLVKSLEKALTTTKTIFNYNFYQMKKGLLSILAAATVLVGCQNYDDQFDALNVQITALQQQVNSSITTAIADLQGQLTTLASSQLSSDDLATALVDITSQIDAINTAVASIDGETSELEEEVDDILAALDDLLQANAVIDQNVNIRNTAELEYVESLIATGADDPTVIVKGNVLVDGTDLDTDALAARVSAVTAKIRTVIGSVTVTADAANINMSAVTFIDGTANISNKVDISALSTVSGDVDLGHYGDVALTALTSVASLTLSNSASITTLEILNLASGDLVTADYPLATSIVLGDIAISGQVTATKATVFTSGFDGTLGSLNLSTTTTAVVRLAATKISGTVTLTNSGAGSEGHFAGLTTIESGGELVNPAKTIDMSALATASGTLTIVGTTAASFPALASQAAAGTITATAAQSFTAPKLVPAAAISTVGTATFSLKSLSTAQADFLTASQTMTGLTTAGQTASLTLYAMPALKSASITGAGKATTNIEISVSATNTALASLSVDGVINTLDIAAAPKLTSLTTAGKITDFSVTDTTTMTTINFGHTFISGDTAATVTVSNVSKITSLDMSSLTKVKQITLTGNAKLATIVAPSSTVLAEPTAAVTVTINGNALTGNYDKAAAGTDTTPYGEASIESNDLTTLKTFINAYAAQTGRSSTSVSATAGKTKISYDIEVDVVTIDGGTTTSTLSAALNSDAAAALGADATADTASDTTDSTGGITTANELAIVTTE